MTALVLLVLALLWLTVVPGAYLLGKRHGRHIQTKQVFQSGYDLGVFYASRRLQKAAKGDAS